MASHAHRIGLLELPRPGRTALPLLALALAALILEADPSLRLAGAAAAGCFAVAASVRIARARGELGRIRRTADRLILADAVGVEGSEIVRWRSGELVAPASRRGLARELEQTVRRLDPGRLPSASPLRRPIARRHTELLERLEQRLLDERPVTPRGIILLQRLLREPGSPLYDDVTERQLARAIATVAAEARVVNAAARTAEEALEPRRLRRVLVGRPMRTGQMDETLLPKWLALPIFASDPLSSVAYATESALVVLIAVSAASAHLVIPISIGIACLLGIVVLSYRQTVRVYETSGGAYVVARENLGTTPSLVAAAALLTDYVLTVAVSISAGIFAITSFAPSLQSHKVELSLACLGLIVLVNLRGVRESGLLFALPTYAFVTSILLLVGVGVVQDVTGHLHRAVVPHPLPAGVGAIGVFVLLRAFSSGSTALTGVEAIANGVNAFRHPQGRNAATTLAVLGALAISMFLGVSFLAVHVHAAPSSTDSVVSQLARAVFQPGSFGSFMYYAVQGTTLLVLVLAANTSFQGFPRLSALLARDRFAPRQFSNLGDRLVFSNGMLVLAAAAAALLVIYKADTNSLIHLYVIGVFTAFTLSQAGMVRYWLRTRGAGWQRKIAVNAVGASATGLVAVIVIWTKFAEGAWLVTVAIPLLVFAMFGVRRHYDRVARRLRAGAAAVASAPDARNRTLLVVESLDDATERGLALARTISPSGLRAIHVPRRGSDAGITPRWFRFSGGTPLLETLARSGGAVETVLDQVWRLPRGESDFVTVVIPEQFRRRSLLEQARHPFEFALKLRLLTEASVVVLDVPTVDEAPSSERPLAVRILVSGANAPSMRAVNWAQSVALPNTQAVNFAFDDAEAAAIRREWKAEAAGVPLEVLAAPYRDIGDPILAYLRELTAEGNDVLVVMPELILRGWRRLLHNQRALYVKRLLLLEPNVLLASVPYPLVR